MVSCTYIGYVAAAGKAVNPLPLYVNAALRDPISNPVHQLMRAVEQLTM